MKVCIIGGVAGGASAAARLRRLDENAEIIMFEKGEFVSYANCGLPYYISGTIENKENLIVTKPQLFRDRFNIDVRVKNEVTSINSDKKELTVINHETEESYTETYDKLILSPGASPKIMFPEAITYNGVFTLRGVPDTVKIKDYIIENNSKKAVVIGGGFIGIETAENLREKGLEVTIIEFAPHVIASLDREMANILHEHIASKGVNIWLKTGVTSITQNKNKLHLKTNTEKEIDTDIVIMSVGVNAETALAENAGLKLGIRKSIAVNKYMQTSDSDIYAVGDAVNIINGVTKKEGLIPLAGPANKQGRAAAENILGGKVPANVSWGSAVLKVFDLTAASTGMSEEGLQRDGYIIATAPEALNTEKKYYKTYIFPSSHAGYYPGATPISMKMLFSPDGKILGAQAIGYEGVEKRIDVIATAQQMQATVYDLEKLELCYAPPFSSAKDPVNFLGFTASNILKGAVKPVYVEELDNNIDKQPVILDVRFEQERLMGKIDKSIHIPLDTLRNHFTELDKNKPIYIYCMVGLRGYVGARQLINKGFKDVYNISGGYKLYKLIKNEKTIWEAAHIIPADSAMGDTVPKAGNTPIKEIEVNACGLQCPGPILKVAENIKQIEEGDKLRIKASDPAFASDIKVWCERTGNTLLEQSINDKGIILVTLQKGNGTSPETKKDIITAGNDKSIIVFSGDLDKAIASFIIANGASSMGRKVTMFFTFWGLNILRKNNKVHVKKNFIERIFSSMMPRGSKKLGLSKMNMGGMGSKMIRNLMKKNNINSLEELIQIAINNDVRIVACTMSMDLMGIKKEELIDGIEVGGVATFLGSAETSDTNLFI